MSLHKRARNWTFVVYPESVHENWIEILGEEIVPYFISPIHDKDLDIENNILKPHYHVVIMYAGVKSYSQVKEVTDKIGSTIPKIVNDIRAMARYLCHLDSHDKIKYDIEDVIEFGGASYTDIISLPTERYQMISEMIQFVNDNDIILFASLLEYSMIHRKDWFRILCDNSTIIMKEYLRSREYRNRLNDNRIFKKG